MQTIDVPEINLPRVIIIGGGFGGMQLVKGLKNKEVQVVLLDRNNYHTFQPLLYQVATAGLEPDSIAFPIRKIFKEYQNFHFRMANVENVDHTIKTIYTNIGSLSYDYLIIATGSKTNFFGNDQIMKYGMRLKTVVQALDVRSLMLQNFEKALLSSEINSRESRMNFVIVGGGPTGVELAGALGELKNHVLPNDYPELDVRRMQIHLIEAGPKLLAGLSYISSDKAVEYLKKLNVNVWLNTRVTDYDGTVVKTNINKTILAKNLVWSAGVMGNAIPGLKDNQFDRAHRILVNEYNEVAEHDSIFAIGDVAAMVTKDTPKGHPMVAPVAMQQGELLAKNLLKRIKGKPQQKFVYHDKGSMATIGRNKAVVEVAKLKWQGAFAWFIWMFVHLISLVGYRNKVIVLVNWLWNYFNYDRGIRLIIRPFVRDKNKKEPVETL
ncbi:NAD(P)/FAD-dependent oxidoreductase [Chondrinema litorale]|uniref:NAD(P)/FAD-dependent oxidoreductase n=1 Tax=Chondrinema litorale TaxID=2994555 RepID=UPI0025426DAE|nr:NAD(P)/FAD-dependent oxidoreductase [Chondrinema litorale]UZR93439.1 NAD(P)/FAD-dependent oxidoreductase [Chondrinema litorale]